MDTTMRREAQAYREHALANAFVGTADLNKWRCITRVEMFDAKTGICIEDRTLVGNVQVYGGASVLWEYALGNGSTSTGSAKHYLNSKCSLGIGDSSAAAAKTQKNLQASATTVHRQWFSLSAGYPQHTTGSTVAGAAQFVLKSTVTSTQGNFAWKEWGIFTVKTTVATQRMINRKAGTALITKTSAATASLTITITTS